MIKILFKAKRIDTGEWVEGDLIHGVGVAEGKVFIVVPFDGMPFGVFTPVDPETVCQFTGLYDDDCKRIFENDILRVCGDVNGIYIVSYKNGAFLLFTPKNTGPCEPFGSGFSTYEVIGNIYDEEKQK